MIRGKCVSFPINPHPICDPTKTTCPSPIQTCDPPKQMVDGKCVNPTPPPPPPPCPTGTHIVGNNCVQDGPVCGSGTHVKPLTKRVA